MSRDLRHGLLLAALTAAGAAVVLRLLATDVPSAWLGAVVLLLALLAWEAMSRLTRDPLGGRLVPVLFGAWLLFLWEALVVGFAIPRVLLPAPSAIGQALAGSPAVLTADFHQTFIRAVLPGWLMGCGAGLATAILVDRIPFLQRGLLPLGNLVSALPVIGIAPIMVMWFGFDWQSKAAVVVVMTFFPMLVNATAGLAAAGRMEHDLMRSYAASYVQTLAKLRLPAALPFIFNALKINSTLALIGAIVAEFFGTPIVGMGFRISTEVGRMNLDLVWATIAVAAVTGSLFYGALALAERALTFWHPSFRHQGGIRMRFTATLAAAAALLAAGSAEAADRLTLQLKWVTQAQFGGYYVAKDKGFYEAVGLDVEIKPGGPDIAPPQVIAGGGADVIVDWMPAALASREKGVPLVNIAQMFKSSGMMLTCRKETGITDPATDFKGRTLGVWFYGNEYPFLSWMATLGIPTQGGPEGVTVIKQGFNVDPLLQKQADCISTMTYNEYWQVIDAGIPADELTVFKYEDQGVATLEDGLYVLEQSLADPAMVDRLARFLKASIQGWEYAQANPDEAALIVLENDATGAQTEEHQKRMMGEINKLVGEGGSKGIGYLDPEDYERTVKVLLSGGSDPVISKEPEGAWTHAVFEAMGKL